jgi:hypothetical protein
MNVIIRVADTRAVSTAPFRELALGTSIRRAIRAIRESLPEVMGVLSAF